MRAVLVVQTSLIVATAAVAAACSSASTSSASPSGPPAVVGVTTLSAVCTDAVGDTEGLDLRRVELTLENDALGFEFVTVQPPDTSKLANYVLVLGDNDGKLLYSVLLLFQGEERNFYKFDFLTSTRTDLGGTYSVSGNVVSGEIRLGALPNLPSPAVGFEWSASAGDLISDSCPEPGPDPDHSQMVPFPS